MARPWWQEAVVYEIYCKSFCDSDGEHRVPSAKLPAPRSRDNARTPYQWQERVSGDKWQRTHTNREETVPSMERESWLAWEAEVYTLLP